MAGTETTEAAVTFEASADVDVGAAAAVASSMAALLASEEAVGVVAVADGG
jgi:hypothetical protein